MTVERPFLNPCCRVYIWSCNNGFILLNKWDKYLRCASFQEIDLILITAHNDGAREVAQ